MAPLLLLPSPGSLAQRSRQTGPRRPRSPYATLQKLYHTACLATGLPRSALAARLLRPYRSTRQRRDGYLPVHPGESGTQRPGNRPRALALLGNASTTARVSPYTPPGGQPNPTPLPPDVRPYVCHCLRYGAISAPVLQHLPSATRSCAKCTAPRMSLVCYGVKPMCTKTRRVIPYHWYVVVHFAHC